MELLHTIVQQGRAHKLLTPLALLASHFYPAWTLLSLINAALIVTNNVVISRTPFKKRTLCCLIILLVFVASAFFVTGAATPFIRDGRLKEPEMVKILAGEFQIVDIRGYISRWDEQP